MPFEPIDSNATPEELDAWVERMTAQGYSMAYAVRIAILDLQEYYSFRRLCQDDSDMYTLCRIASAYFNLCKALQRESDVTFRRAVTRASESLHPALVLQVDQTMSDFRKHRMELLASREDADKRRVTIRRSAELVAGLPIGESWEVFPTECNTRLRQEIEYWRTMLKSFDQ